MHVTDRKLVNVFDHYDDVSNHGHEQTQHPDQIPPRPCHQEGCSIAYTCRTNTSFSGTAMDKQHMQINTTRSKVVLSDCMLQIASCEICFVTMMIYPCRHAFTDMIIDRQRMRAPTTSNAQRCAPDGPRDHRSNIPVAGMRTEHQQAGR